jgi:hypothetical protein
MSDEKDRQTIAIPNQVRDAMIVPRASVPLPTAKTSFTLLQQNWIFSQQWKKADTTGRNVVECKVGGVEKDYLDAITQAAKTARGREVILAVGHGGAGDFRGLTQTVFDAIPNAAHGLESHPFAITREVLELPDIAEKKDGKWVPKKIKVGNVITTESQGKVDSLVPRFEMMQKSGEILRAGGVSRFVLLACNVAKDAPKNGKKDFLSLLAGVLGVEVVAYGGLVAIGEVTFKDPGRAAETKEQIWIAMDETDTSKGRPPDDDRDHASFHELPATARLSAAPPPSPAPPP